MKKISILGLSFLSAIAFAVIFFFNACTTDPCKDVTCLNDGTCLDGTCQCTDGYEGNDCGTLWETKFLGNYSLSGTDNNGYTYSNIAVTIGTSSTGVTTMIFTITATGTTFPVTLTSSSTFTINSTVQNGFTYTGQGNIAGTTLSMTINETNNSTSDLTVYTWSGPKQ